MSWSDLAAREAGKNPITGYTVTSNSSSVIQEEKRMDVGIGDLEYPAQKSIIKILPQNDCQKINLK